MRDNIQKIEVDYKNKIIKCGNLFTIDSYVPNLDWKYVSGKCGVYINPFPKNNIVCGTKQNNKKVSDKLGIPPKKYANMLRGIQYKLWLKDHKELIFKLCTFHSKNRHIIDRDKIKRFHQNIDLIEQFQNDGLDNLIPFTFSYKRTTKELKDELGKSLWKSLCKNSFTRNKLICERTFFEKKRIDKLNKISSSILKNNKINHNISIATIWLNNFLTKERALSTKKYDHEFLFNLANDTNRMSKRLNCNFNVNWSLKKLEQKHKEFTLLIEQDKYPDTFIKCLKDIKIKEYKNEKYVAKLIDTPYNIKKQGIEQKHCVASYVNEVCVGRYLVYDIKEDDKTVSTLGIYNDDNKFKFSQQYGSCNSKVCEDLVDFAEDILIKLNKEK